MRRRDRRTKTDNKGDRPEIKRQGSRRGKRQQNDLSSSSTSRQQRERVKRSGVDAVKLHLKATGGVGRTSRSATAATKCLKVKDILPKYQDLWALPHLKNPRVHKSRLTDFSNSAQLLGLDVFNGVRKTSIRMTAIKEYPFDLSDLKNQNDGEEKPPLDIQDLGKVPPRPSITNAPLDGKRKVSILANQDSKDRENLPSDNRNGRISTTAEGPSRRKSNLHNAMAAEMDSSWDRPAHIEGRYKKYSTTSSVYSKKAYSQQSEHIERSWWYACCQKCHQEESGIPTWEPPNWQKICPYPLCPSYRQFAQTVSVFIIGILAWLIVWMIMGDTAAPGGQMFTLVVLTLAAYFGGWLMSKITTLPALIGMLIVGIILKNVNFVNFDSSYLKVASYIRKIALTIILTRAGLDLDPIALKKYFVTVLKLALVPWTFECVLCSVMAHYLLGLPWDWAFLLGSIVAAVSPAVIVPCLFRLRAKGYGVSKGIPTLVLAVSGVDDAASVAVFGIVSSLMFSTSSVTVNIIQGPVSIVVGILFGILCGYFVKFVPERNDAFLVPLRVLLLLTGGVVSVIGSEEIGWGGAGPLAVIVFAFIACKNWVDLGWELDDNPVATAFEIFWMFFEPMLFGITGAQVVIADLDLIPVLKGSGILVLCVVLRSVLTSSIAFGSNLNTKEKIFVGLSWMAKATVQAALAPVALDEIRKIAGPEGPLPELLEYAETVITVCILSIVITAPIGAIIITIAGPRLLSRTTKPPVLEGWRRSHRPSIRDISIIDEDEAAERDEEADAGSPPGSPPLGAPASAPAAYSTPTPITVQPNNRT